MYLQRRAHISHPRRKLVKQRRWFLSLQNSWYFFNSVPFIIILVLFSSSLDSFYFDEFTRAVNPGFAKIRKLNYDKTYSAMRIKFGPNISFEWTNVCWHGLFACNLSPKSMRPERLFQNRPTINILHRWKFVMRNFSRRKRVYSVTRNVCWQKLTWIDSDAVKDVNF